MAESWPGLRGPGESGRPIASADPDNPQAEAINAIAQKIAARIAVRNQGNVLRVI